MDIDLDRCTEDSLWPGLKIYSRFSSLGRYSDLLAEFVPMMQDQAQVRWKAATQKEPPTSPDQFVEALEGLQVTVLHDIGRNFYGAFVLAIAAGLEASLLEVCEYVRVKECTTLAVKDLRGGSAVARALLYLEHMLGGPLQAAARTGKSVSALQAVRNAIAHGNGELSAQDESRRRELDTLVKANIGIEVYSDHILVHPPFLAASLSAADELVEDALLRLSTHYPRVA